MNASMRRAIVLVGLLLGVGTASAQEVQLDVRFKLTDEDYKPLAEQPVRIAFGPGSDWAAPDVGQRATTDAQGEAQFTAKVELGTAREVRDTSWLNVVDAGEEARTLEAYVALPFLGQEWLYGVKTYTFADGDGMHRGFDVYLPDASGRYTRKFSEDAGTHTIDLGNGMVMQGSGYSPWEAQLEPVDGASDRWTLKLSFMKHPEPVRR